MTENTGTEPDDLKRGMDEWQADMTLRLLFEYGCRPMVAAGLAGFMRAEVEDGPRRPMPLICVTGI